MKFLIVLILFFSSLHTIAQNHTFKNNKGTNYMNGITGELKDSSIPWTIENLGDGIYNIKYSPCYNNDCSINVKYSHFDKQNKLYVYIPVGSLKFDGAFLSKIMCSGKLSDYSKGIAEEGKNLLGIVFHDDSGYIYILND